MKRFTRFIFLLFLFACLGSFSMHKFYVAVFRLEHIPEKKVVQMTSRTFIDDLDAALYNKYEKKMYLATSKEVEDIDKYLEDYFVKKMQVKLNGAEKGIKYLGKKIEDDILICYYTIAAEETVHSIEMRNTVLFEMFSEQQNIIHTTVNRNKRSLLLTNDKPKGTLEF